MTDIRSKNSPLKIPSINFTYEVAKDLYGSFDVNLNWDFNFLDYPEIKEFRVYKSVLPQPRLIKEYNIQQDGLEKLTRGQNYRLVSNILYNKSLISQNSKVTVENSNTTQHKKDESINGYSFFNIAKISANKKDKSYKFLDKNVKFGETYNYYVTAITKKHQETLPKPAIVNVEWPNSPPAPYIFNVSELSDGLLITVGNGQDFFTSKFVILRREDSEKDFIKLAELENSSEVVNFVDKTVEPKKNYIYRAYSKDIFGNISLSGMEKTGTYRHVLISTNIEFRPSVLITNVNMTHFQIRLKNNRPDKVKFVIIQRRDDWKFDQNFEVKKYNDLYWPTFFFDQNQEINFEDTSSQPDKVYTYKIISYNEKSQPVSYMVTPNLKVGEVFSNLNVQSPVFKSPQFSKFNIEVLSERQNPVNVKFDWEIDGDWSHLIVKNKDEQTKIDNIHNSIILNSFKKNGSYSVSVELYDINSKKVYEMQNLLFKT